MHSGTWRQGTAQAEELNASYCCPHRHKPLGRLPPSLPCTHRSPDWLPLCRSCKTSDILQEDVQPKFRLTTHFQVTSLFLFLQKHWWDVYGVTAAFSSALCFTCAQGEGVVPHFTEVAISAVEAELPFVTGVTAALPVPATSPVAVTRSISVTRSFRAPHTGYATQWQRSTAKVPLYVLPYLSS